MDHLGPTLSAYLDGALDPAERAAAESHLAGCAACRDQLAELRATARLVAALPAARPSRSLVPRVAGPAWARPVRSLATVASGLFVLVFIASAALSSGLGGGGKGSLLQPLSGGGTAARPAASEAQATAASNARSAFASPAPAPAASFGLAPVVTGATAQPGVLQNDASKSVSGTSGPGALGASARADAVSAAPTRVFTPVVAEPAGAQLGPTPLLWLALALASAAVAFVAHRRASRA